MLLFRGRQKQCRTIKRKKYLEPGAHAHRPAIVQSTEATLWLAGFVLLLLLLLLQPLFLATTICNLSMAGLVEAEAIELLLAQLLLLLLCCWVVL